MADARIDKDGLNIEEIEVAKRAGQVRIDLYSTLDNLEEAGVRIRGHATGR